MPPTLHPIRASPSPVVRRRRRQINPIRVARRVASHRFQGTIAATTTAAAKRIVTASQSYFFGAFNCRPFRVPLVVTSGPYFPATPRQPSRPRNRSPTETPSQANTQTAVRIHSRILAPVWRHGSTVGALAAMVAVLLIAVMA